MKFPKPNGGYYDHITELKNSVSGLTEIKNRLDALSKDPTLDDVTRQKMLDVIQQADTYVSKVNQIFNDKNYPGSGESGAGGSSGSGGNSNSSGSSYVSPIIPSIPGYSGGIPEVSLPEMPTFGPRIVFPRFLFGM